MYKGSSAFQTPSSAGVAAQPHPRLLFPPLLHPLLWAAAGAALGQGWCSAQVRCCGQDPLPIPRCRWSSPISQREGARSSPRLRLCADLVILCGAGRASHARGLPGHRHSCAPETAFPIFLREQGDWWQKEKILVTRCYPCLSLRAEVVT